MRPLPPSLACYLSQDKIAAGQFRIFKPDDGFTNLFPEMMLYEWTGTGTELLHVKWELHYDNGETGTDIAPWPSPGNGVANVLSFLAHIDGIWWNGLSPSAPKRPVSLTVTVDSDTTGSTAILSLSITGKQQ